MAPELGRWKVVGGASKGGIIVRTGKEITSPEEAERLATGALVEAVEHDEAAQRILFKKVSGEGPASGWVSTAFKGKEMLARAPEEAVKEDAEGIVMQLYCQRFGQGEGQDGVKFGWNRKSFDWKQEVENVFQGNEQVCENLKKDLILAATTKKACQNFAASTAMQLCSHCQLPVGEARYQPKDGKPTYTHGECLAQLMLRELQEQEEVLMQKEAAKKRERREEYDIGWRVESIPRNVTFASKLQACPAYKGMCCLVFDQDSGRVGVAPTVEPAAAVNLEYLATALQVRLRDGREPMFSLDPVDPHNPKDSMQMKRFEPAWLAGTSVGEVLFQADYHLKELSMGEYEQPVLGMNSIHDYSEADEQDKWKAREWFVVRKAEVLMTDDSVLMPSVKMGVEAREQILGDQGLEDVKTTRPNHPLVKYADSFTHNFDLIAERKSVVCHLRELAKASVLAKFLFEADAVMDDSWFKAAGETKDACCLEIPQLWNERCESQITVQDGKIVNADALGTSMHRLYGGVQFGLDKFQLSGGRQPARMMSAGLAARQFVQPARHMSATLSAGLATRQFQRSFGPMGVQPARVSAGVGLDKFALAGARQPARMMSAGLAARQFVQPARHLSATLSAGLATRQFQRSFGPMGVQPSRVAGVDLNLDEFNLSSATHVEASAQIAKGVDISGAFWENLSEEANFMFSEEDRRLLQSVFNPRLSDRRDEGDLFTPPDVSFAYVQGLRALIKEEEEVRKQRKLDFCATAFDMESPGLLFPFSWRSSVRVSREAAAGRKGRVLQARPDFKAQNSLFEPALKDAAPIFDKSTEDGTRFRIYRIGSLEVRTMQEFGAKESIGAVFSLQATAQAAPVAMNDQEKVVKATEYVEASCFGPRTYIVLETELKNFIVVDRTPESLRREENPKDLEDRNSLAKVLSARECKKGLTVESVRRFQGDNLFSFAVGQK